VNGGTLSNSGSITMGGTGGSGTLSLNNGASVYATNIVVYTNSTLGGNGTVNAAPGGVTVQGGTIGPTGTNSLVINGDLNFNAPGSTYLWSLFNSTTNIVAGVNFTVPLQLNGNLSVTTGSLLNINLTNTVASTDSLWTTSDVTNSWVLMQGTNSSITNGLNFSLNFIGLTNGFSYGAFSLGTNGADQLVLNYFLPSTINWTATNGDWAASTNWSNSIQPSSNSTVAINNGGTANITNAAGTIGNLIIGTNTGSNALVITAPGGLNVTSNTVIGQGTNASNNSLTLNGGSLTNGGNLIIGSNGSSNSMLIAGGGSASASNTIIGAGASASNNTLTVNNGSLSNSGNLYVGSNGPNNTLVIGTNTNSIVTAANTYIGFGATSSNNLLSVNGGTLSNSGSITMGGTGGSGTLSLNNGSRVFATNVTVNAGSTLAGNGTITAPVNVNGGTMAPSGSSALTVNGTLSFSNSAIYQWTLFNNTISNPGENYSAPLSLTNGSLSVTSGSVFDLFFTNPVNSGNSFWTPGVTNSWVVMTGSNVSAGTNFGIAFAPGSVTNGFSLSDFFWSTNASGLVLNYYAIPGYTNSSGTNTLPTNNANVVVTGGTLNIQGSGTTTISNLLITSGTVATGSNATVLVNTFTNYGGAVEGGSNAHYWADNYYFAATNPGMVGVNLDNLGTITNYHSTATITTNVNGLPVAPVVFNTDMGYDGGTVITGGILQLGSSNSSGPVTIQGDITNNGYLNYGYNGASTTPTNLVIGGGVIGQVGTGTLTLGSSGVGTNFTGSFAAANGTLQITTNSALGSSTNYYLADNGALQFTAGVITVTNAIQVTNGTGIVENSNNATLALNGTLTKSGTVLVLAGGSFEVNGQVTGSGAPDSFNSDLVVSNATVILNNGNNNYTGPTYVVGGSTLQNGVENALPTNTLLTMGALSDGAVVNTYDLNPNNQTIAALASAGGATNIVQASTQGSQTLTINGAQSSTYSGLIQSAVALIRSGTGNTTLTGSNSYSGGTTILSGSLTTANVRALGSGGVSLNGGRLIVQSLLNIASLNWNGAGVIALPNAGAKQYVNATGNLVINGSKNTFDLSGLQLTSTPVELLASANMSGFNTNEFAATGVTDYSLLISNNALWIEALGRGYVSYPNFIGYAINRNQTNVATALNSFTNKPTADQTVVLNSLQALTNSPASMQQAFNAIMPNFYQQMATIAFNGANAQNMELNQRLWGMRVAQGGGFSMTGFADNTPFLQEGQGDGEGKGVLDAKKDILRPGLDNRWGMFLDANGIFANANSANMLPGYQSESGGVTTGLTYKWNKNVSTGLYAGYQGTYNKSGANGSGLGVGSTLIDNAVRFGLFGTYGEVNSKGEPLGFYANALAGGAYNNYQAARIIDYPGMNRTANSSPGAGELDTMLAGGYDVKKGNFTFGPTASLQYTYLGANGVNETGAQSLDFNSAGWNSASMLSSVGAHAAYTWYARKLQGHEITVVPQINLNWQHEFMQNPYAINGNLGGTTPNFSNWSAAPLRDTLYTGVGFTVEFAKKWNTSFFYNAAAGNQNLQSQNIFWSVGAKF
jgi:autotransporter-associated beta strand protein